MGIRQIGVAALIVSTACMLSACGSSSTPTAPTDPGTGGGGGGGGGEPALASARPRSPSQRLGFLRAR